jgi:hypothetical protein
VTALEANPMTLHQVQWAWATYHRAGLVSYLRGQALIQPMSPLSLELLWLHDVAALLR